MIRASLFAALGACLLSFPAVAQSTTVELGIDADMQTLRDQNNGDLRDKFTVTIKDADHDITWAWLCTSGRDLFGGLARADKECGFQGGSAGKIRNPKLPATDPAAWVARTQYSGKFVVKGDGKTDLSGLTVNYLPSGKPQTFSGELALKPGLNSSNFFADLADKVMAKLELEAGGSIDPRVDTVDGYSVFVPSAGFPSDKGCVWNIHQAFPYQVFSWYMELKATCTTVVNKQDVKEEFNFAGNMPFLGDNTVDGTTTYNLVLTVGGVETDESLFVDSEDESLFAEVQGITGVITMTNSQIVELTLDGQPIKNPVKVSAKGTLTGTGVSPQVVRSFALLLGLIPGTYVGP